MSGSSPPLPLPLHGALSCSRCSQLTRRLGQVRGCSKPGDAATKTVMRFSGRLMQTTVITSFRQRAADSASCVFPLKPQEFYPGRPGCPVWTPAHQDGSKNSDMFPRTGSHCIRGAPGSPRVCTTAPGATPQGRPGPDELVPPAPGEALCD